MQNPIFNRPESKVEDSVPCSARPLSPRQEGSVKTPRRAPIKTCPPKLKTANRSRKSALSTNSETPNDIKGLFEKRIEYKALQGNALDERLA